MLSSPFGDVGLISRYQLPPPQPRIASHLSFQLRLETESADSLCYRAHRKSWLPPDHPPANFRHARALTQPGNEIRKVS